MEDCSGINANKNGYFTSKMVNDFSMAYDILYPAIIICIKV